MWQRISASAFLVLCGILIIGMWNEIVLMPSIIILLSIFLIFFHFILKVVTGEQDNLANQLLVFTVSIYLAILPPSFLYYRWEKWGFGNFISATFIMKISLVLFVLSVVYLHYLVRSTKTMYKKKRENERIKKIKENVKEKPFVKIANLFHKEEKKTDSDPAEAIQLVLGKTAEKNRK